MTKAVYGMHSPFLYLFYIEIKGSGDTLTTHILQAGGSNVREIMVYNNNFLLSF